MDKLIATPKALEVIDLLKNKHGELIFQQSSGCCDGTVPMCFKVEGHYISSQNILVGYLLDVPYYIDKSQVDYLKHMQIIVDVLDGYGASFSLESLEGYGFIMRSKIIE